jgi:ABC-2 type transport system permease protein
MSGNSSLELVYERGWSRGLNNMLRSELARWFRTRMWWIQCLIWGGLLGFMLSALLFSKEKAPLDVALTVFVVFAGLFPAVGVVIIMQDALVGEKREGTAAWVLSKPVTRPAFILSKVIANIVGVLVTMIVVPFGISYTLLAVAERSALNSLGFLGAMGVIFISDFFFLTLTLMLGTFFANRGPVIGIALGLLFLQQNLLGFMSSLRFILPWNLVLPLSDSPDSLAFSLLMGTPVQSDYLIMATVVLAESILFVLIALRRFNREEL